MVNLHFNYERLIIQLQKVLLLHYNLAFYCKFTLAICSIKIGQEINFYKRDLKITH